MTGRQADDARLLEGDGLDSAAQIGAMVERDRRQHRGELLFDHIRRVEPAAKASLQQHNVRRVLREGKERRGRGDLEKGDGFAGIRGLGPAQDIHQLRLADGARAARPCQHDAFVEAAQMRGDERMRPVARRLQHGPQERDGRALPVRAGHMNDRRQPPVRTPERPKQPLHPAQGQVDALRVKLFEPCKQAPGLFRCKAASRLCEIEVLAWEDPLTPPSPQGERESAAALSDWEERFSRVPSPLGEKDRMRGSSATSKQLSRPRAKSERTRQHAPAIP
jgi:hypothetical protein